MSAVRRATGPGRVTLIGDHTDYNAGVALPMAIDLGTTVEYRPGDDGRIRVSSAAVGPDGPIGADGPIGPGGPVGSGGPVELDATLDARADAIGAVEPEWARLVAAMIALSPTAIGGRLTISSTVPIGAGLSSSAALCVALAEVLAQPGTDPGSAVTIARRCQRAEHLAGRPVGAMDPLVCAGGVAGHALLVDFPGLAVRPVRLPPGVDVIVVDSGTRRTLGSSAYADRVAECAAAAEVIGPLGSARTGDLARLADPLLRRRARHVVSECARVHQVVGALEAGDPAGAGFLLTESHHSLAEDFEVSTPGMDALVARVAALPGVLGARMTGAGFGGCVVALCRAGAVDPERLGVPAWRVHAVDGTVARRDPTRERV